MYMLWFYDYYYDYVAIWPPKQEILISCRWNFDAIYRSSRDIIFPVWAAILLFPVVSHCRNQLNSSWSTDCQVEYVFSIVFNFDVKISNLPKMSHSTILLSHYVTHFNILNYWVTFSYQWGFSWKSEITEVSSFSWPVADCSYVKLKFIWSCGGWVWIIDAVIIAGLMWYVQMSFCHMHLNVLALKRRWVFWAMNFLFILVSLRLNSLLDDSHQYPYC